MASIENSEHGMPKQSGVADLIVKGAIALVTAAFFIGAYLQFQVSFWLALIAALSVYIMLLMVHALMRRSERETELVSEVTRLEDEVARLQDGAASGEGVRRERAPTFAPAASRQRHTSAPPVRRHCCASLPVAPPPAPPVSEHRRCRRPRRPEPPRIFRDTPASATSASRSLMAHRPGAMSSEPQRPDPMFSVPSALAAEELQPGPTLPDWSTPPARIPAPGDQMHDYWPARQAKPSLPEGPRVELPPMPSLAGRARDRSRCRARHDQASRRRGERRRRASLDGLPPPRQESVLRASLNALQTTANAMRATKKKGGLPASG